MPVPAASVNFADLLDPRFQTVFVDQYNQLPDVIPRLYGMPNPEDAPTKADYRTTQIGAFGDLSEFGGSVVYDDVVQGYDTTMTHKEYVTGFQITRTMFDDDLFGIMDARPKGMAQAYQRTRQKHAAQTFVNAFSVDTTWQSGGDALALCSNAHTSSHPSTSTTTGFDNLTTAALSATAVTASRILAKKFRDDRGNPFEVDCTALLYPVDLYDSAREIVESTGKVDTANNNINVHYGQITSIFPAGWIRLSDVNDWFMVDETYMKQFLLWLDRVKSEFGMVEAFDELIGKWRLYCRYSLGWSDWRWILGAQVS